MAPPNLWSDNFRLPPASSYTFNINAGYNCGYSGGNIWGNLLEGAINLGVTLLGTRLLSGLSVRQTSATIGNGSIFGYLSGGTTNIDLGSITSSSSSGSSFVYVVGSKTTPKTEPDNDEVPEPDDDNDDDNSDTPEDTPTFKEFDYDATVTNPKYSKMNINDTDNKVELAVDDNNQVKYKKDSASGKEYPEQFRITDTQVTDNSDKPNKYVFTFIGMSGDNPIYQLTDVEAYAAGSDTSFAKIKYKITTGFEETSSGSKKYELKGNINGEAIDAARSAVHTSQLKSNPGDDDKAKKFTGS